MLCWTGKSRVLGFRFKKKLSYFFKQKTVSAVQNIKFIKPKNLKTLIFLLINLGFYQPQCCRSIELYSIAPSVVVGTVMCLCAAASLSPRFTSQSQQLGVLEGGHVTLRCAVIGLGESLSSV